MNEKYIERKLVEAVRRSGGLAPKFVSPGWDGAPDRIILLPGGHAGFVEIKAPGKKPVPLQERRHMTLRSLGFPVFVMDGPGQEDGIIEEVRRWRA